MHTKNDRISQLESLIQKYQASYYNGEAEISDEQFDLLWDELKTLAPDSPVLQKVGKDSTDGFPKAKHLIPMGSQEKAANPEEFLAWTKKQGRREKGTGNNEQGTGNNLSSENETCLFQDKITNKNPTPYSPLPTPLFIVQFKLDGASLELQYKNGKLDKAVTRGDGIIGDDITANARRMKGVVEKLDLPFTGGVRGEVIMTRTVHKAKYSDKANCRNAANGLMRRKDGNGCEDLTLIAYDASAQNDDGYFKTESEKIEWLKKRGFETAETKEFDNAEDIIKYREKISKSRDKLPFDIDGLVVKDNETDMADLRKARPEKQIAFKFELETAYSMLLDIEWSESGATYTPIGIIEPVRLAGTTVKRANLNNPDMIRTMGLKIGSMVAVVKRGEIIPKIEGLAPHVAGSREQVAGEKPSVGEDIIFPTTCNVCNTKLIDAGTRLYCPNGQCPKRLLHRLEKWVSVLDIRELGEKLIRQLFENGRVRHIHDLYSLTAKELGEFERMGEKSAAKVIRHIQTKRELSLAAFVAGFDLENVAETTMEKIAAAGFDTLEKLRSATVADLQAVYGLGEITASVIVEGLKECAPLMDKVLKAGVISIAPPPSEESQPLRGLSFCFTGELKTMKRSAAEEKVKALGAQAKSSVVKGLSYLVTNDPSSGSSKNKKANELGVKIIDEEEFLSIIAGTQLGNTESAQGELF